MKLRYSPTSPYVRKVTVTLIETGLEDRVERIPTSVWDPETDIATVNPLGKIPALITDDGEVLFDSPVICEYLDGLHDGDRLFPASGAPRWRALRLLALGDELQGLKALIEALGRIRENQADFLGAYATVFGALNTLVLIREVTFTQTVTGIGITRILLDAATQVRQDGEGSGDTAATAPTVGDTPVDLEI